MARFGLERRDWKRLSKGRKDGVGLPSPGLEARDGNMLLPGGEEKIEPWGDCKQSNIYLITHHRPELKESRLVLIAWSR